MGRWVRPAVAVDEGEKTWKAVQKWQRRVFGQTQATDPPLETPFLDQLLFFTQFARLKERDDLTDAQKVEHLFQALEREPWPWPNHTTYAEAFAAFVNHQRDQEN